MRQGWARWAGAAAAATIGTPALQRVAMRGEVEDLSVLLASVTTLVLLLLPATGRVFRRSRRGRVLAVVAFFALVAQASVGSWMAWSGEAPATLSASVHAPSAVRAPSPSPSPSPKWHDFGPGLARSRADAKPMLVEFHAVWCGYCRQMEAETLRAPEVVQALERVVAVRVDGEEMDVRQGHRGAELANRFGVRTYPTMVLVSPDGKIVSRAAGFMPAPKFLYWLKLSLVRSAQLSLSPPTHSP